MFQICRDAGLVTCWMMPVVRDMMTAHWQLEVAMAVTKKPSRHFFLIHSKGKESDTWGSSSGGRGRYWATAIAKNWPHY
jgi:hypothetical protein